MRKGSIALVNAIIEKSGINRKRMVSVGGWRAMGGRSLMGWSGQRASFGNLRDRDAVTLSQRHRRPQQPSSSPSHGDRFRYRHVAWAQEAARGRARTRSDG